MSKPILADIQDLNPRKLVFIPFPHFKNLMFKHRVEFIEI